MFNIIKVIYQYSEILVWSFSDEKIYSMTFYTMNKKHRENDGQI